MSGGTNRPAIPRVRRSSLHGSGAAHIAGRRFTASAVDVIRDWKRLTPSVVCLCVFRKSSAALKRIGGCVTRYALRSGDSPHGHTEFRNPSIR